MGEVAWTPGPWSVDSNSTADGVDIVDDTTQAVVASVWPQGEDSDDPTMRTNARLLSAAPELRESLRMWATTKADIRVERNRALLALAKAQPEVADA